MKTIEINIHTQAASASLIFPEIQSLRDQSYFTAAVMEFEETEQGKWLLQCAQNKITYDISDFDPNAPGSHLGLTARARLKDKDYTFYNLKWGQHE